MTREIHCEECKTYLGEIRDAKLKKGLVCLCDACEKKRRAMKWAMETRGSNVADLFGGLFR